MGHGGLEQLDVWRESKEFARRICAEVVPSLPQDEKYSMATQLRRSAQSIPANIAEAVGRYHYADAVRYCHIARGSLEETLSHLLLGKDLGYIKGSEMSELREGYGRVQRLLNGYIAYLRRERAAQDRRK